MVDGHESDCGISVSVAITMSVCFFCFIFTIDASSKINKI